ncbi:MAG: hypothetical protein FWG56_02230 [Desulfovibrionaceae bacterium]|nr:hypothetical protein [Desulfovibrionaceae bacterium]
MNSNTTTPETLPDLSRQERQDRNKALLLDALKSAGAIRAAVTYSGGGDEGYADGIVATAADGKPIRLSAPVSLYVVRSDFIDGQWQSAIVLKELPLEDALSNFAMEALEERHAGWEINDGGEGEVVFDCAKGVVRIEHNDYYTESEHTETTL